MLGASSRGTPIRLNRSYCEADLKISVGAVMPHPYMGFGGGAKLVVPGLAGIDTLQANHQPAVTGISGGLANPDVDARHDVEEIALRDRSRLQLQRRGQRATGEIAGLCCGHPVSAHRAAVRFATRRLCDRDAGRALRHRLPERLSEGRRAAADRQRAQLLPDGARAAC